MELTEVFHTEINSLDRCNPDYFIAASSYEARSIAVSEKYQFPDTQKIVLSFIENRTDLSKPSNDNFFKLNDFRFFQASAFELPDFKTILGEITKSEIKILFDITVMPGIWYHAFFNYIQQLRNCKTVEVKITYVPAIYHAPRKIGNKFKLKQSPKLYPSDGLMKNNKKTALIMGLGVEKSISNKVNEIIQPDVTHLLYADPAISQEYVENVLVNNHEIISRTPIRNLHSYPITDTKRIYSYLIDLVMPLRGNRYITIVPLGPKIFTLMAILINLTYPDIELFYPQYKIKSMKDMKAIDEIISIDLLFSVH